MRWGCKRRRWMGGGDRGNRWEMRRGVLWRVNLSKKKSENAMLQRTQLEFPEFLDGRTIRYIFIRWQVQSFANSFLFAKDMFCRNWNYLIFLLLLLLFIYLANFGFRKSFWHQVFGEKFGCYNQWRIRNKTPWGQFWSSPLGNSQTCPSKQQFSK